MFVIDLVVNLRELYLRNYECVCVRTDLYMKLHTELGRLCFCRVFHLALRATRYPNMADMHLFAGREKG